MIAKLIKNKTFWIVIGTILVIQGVMASITPMQKYLSYVYYSYKMESLVKETSSAILQEKLASLEYNKTQAIRKIEKEYLHKKTELEENYKHIISDSILVNKRNLKDQIEKGEDIDLNTIKKISLNYKDNFTESVMKNRGDLLVFTEYEKPVLGYSVEDFESEEAFNSAYIDYNLQFDDIDIKQVKSKETTDMVEVDYKEEKKVKQADKKNSSEAQRKQRTKRFEVEVQKTLPSGIQILDKNKYEDVLSYGITFPSFFSYKKNGVKMPSNYYDNHYGVDYKTAPLIYINLPFFRDKEAIVYHTVNTQHERNMILTTKNGERFEYLHLEALFKKDGETVRTGEVFAQTGQSGLAKGPHLHFVYQKDGFYVPFDWGLDIENTKALQTYGFSKEEAEEIVKLGKGDIINMESVFGIYMELKDKKIEDLKKIKELIRAKEKEGLMSLNDVLMDDFFEDRLEDIPQMIVIKARKNIDAYHELKKSSFGLFLRENKANADKVVNFNILRLGDFFAKKKVEHKVTFTPYCNTYTSAIYSKYKGKILKEHDMSFLLPYAQDNITHIAPLIYQGIQESNFLQRLKDKTGLQNLNIGECDILLMELGKWYQEHTFYADNPNKAGVFQNLSKDYYKEFPNEVGKAQLSNAQYLKQVNDTLDFMLNKVGYLTKERWKFLAKKKGDDIGDHVIKYMLWSYHGLVGNDPDKNFYVANNLYYANLPLRDISATRKTAYKDGAFTVAAKLYLNIIENGVGQ